MTTPGRDDAAGGQPPPDHRRFTRGVLLVAAILAALALVVWVRSCGTIAQCEERGGRWDEELKQCLGT